MQDSRKAKHIRVSEKRQITIPKSFYDTLGIGSEVVCELRGNEIVLKPLPQAVDFSTEILEELIREGYEGETLLSEFQKRKQQIRPAVERLVEEAKEIAKKTIENDDDNTELLFGDVKE
ncbi:hypothetical protein DCC39_15010 [Pueribacillus theae]|uniref:SpoVT-AbrB domain-containing protein n=2 Tax=Pueribacillus theae TaxID=2171751 RepID=A0A2U1JT70_9BACI|nr:hypothetical protein DCC39_15010 [Pueribacillus theae]